jgi:para-aminobenzoate synthetase component I
VSIKKAHNLPDFEQLSAWGRDKQAFFAIVNFDGDLIAGLCRDAMHYGSGAQSGSIQGPQGRIHFRFSHQAVGAWQGKAKESPLRVKTPPDHGATVAAIESLQQEMRQGMSYLVNYCTATAITVAQPPAELFEQSTAPYTVWYEGVFMAFSPEAFVKIDGNTIATTPMKGTAYDREALIADSKEKSEHATVVDLLRNDLGRIASGIEIADYRFVTAIPQSGGKTLFQTSTRITGQMPENWRDNIGNWLAEILPAGSISGAPKYRTVELIRRYETEPRGFFTGVAVYFDGDSLTSAVLIRYLDLTAPQLKFRSGAGITIYSDAASEYEEILSKVYIPVDGLPR